MEYPPLKITFVIFLILALATFFGHAFEKGAVMFRFLHSSDLHLGKPFGGFPEDVRARLRQARAGALPRLAGLARAHGAGHILLAGDTFDQTTPAPQVIRHALNAMRAEADVHWWVLPGNHDHLHASELWRQAATDAPENVTLLLSAQPLTISPGVTLLPAPATERSPGRDLTDWFDRATTPEGLRLGLAHGSVTDFGSSEDGAAAVIAPDRARRAGLAYLALGDWHGARRIDARTWYSGAPEADSFKHDGTPAALMVTLEGASDPQVTPLPTATLHWQRIALTVEDGADAAAALNAALPPLDARASTLYRVQATGRARPQARAALDHAIARAAPDFLWHDVDLSALSLAHDTADLDLLDRQGALRAAAQALAAEADDPALPAPDRATAQAALSWLFTYALDEAE